MSWGYGNCSTVTFAQELQNNKKLINTTCNGTKVYKSTSGKGISIITVLLHDNRDNNFSSKVIIKQDCEANVFDVPNYKYLKDIYKFIETKLKELRYISSI